MYYLDRGGGAAAESWRLLGVGGGSCVHYELKTGVKKFFEKMLILVFEVIVQQPKSLGSCTTITSNIF